VGLQRWDPQDLAKTLLEEHRIFTVGIDRPGVRGLRITPNLYTTLEELDSFVAVMKRLAA